MLVALLVLLVAAAAPRTVLGSAGRGGGTPVTLALAGAAVTALLHTLIQAILVGDQETLDGLR